MNNCAKLVGANSSKSTTNMSTMFIIVPTWTELLSSKSVNIVGVLHQHPAGFKLMTFFLPLAIGVQNDCGGARQVLLVSRPDPRCECESQNRTYGEQQPPARCFERC